MRSLVVALVIFVLGASAMALTLSKTVTYAGATIQAGDHVLPSPAGVSIPARPSFATVTMSRNNWPLAGATISLEETYDQGQTWQTCAGPQPIAHAEIDPKTGVIAPASISCGRNPDRGVNPDSGRLRVVNPGGAFVSDIEVKYYTD